MPNLPPWLQDALGQINAVLADPADPRTIDAILADAYAGSGVPELVEAAGRIREHSVVCNMKRLYDISAMCSCGLDALRQALQKLEAER